MSHADRGLLRGRWRGREWWPSKAHTLRKNCIAIHSYGVTSHKHSHTRPETGTYRQNKARRLQNSHSVSIALHKGTSVYRGAHLSIVTKFPTYKSMEMEC
ncbi:GD21595 [Drosophila simulans]|uniref:GD21595 n=1 Tax=Drosophila simulans TaxID=7240 RepID=B4QT84_DROSI|nr:GD21595 [Drosophila simulans]